MEKILLDTDIGSDIDDAVCLAYLLRHPQCDLKGITTVSGEPVKRAMLASALCKSAGKDIPIYPGVENPLLTVNRQPAAPQAAALERWEHETKFPENDAIAFMRQVIHDNPHEITLLAIGPMTNVGLLFATDPEIPGLLKQLVLMCGVFTYQIPHGPTEWNALCDPYATAIMYNAPVKICKSIGLDVTCQVQMSKAEVEQNFKGAILKPVLDFAGVWFKNAGDYLTFHDPLAAVTIFEDDVCTFGKGTVQIELTSEKLKGYTYWEKNESGRHEVALTVNKEAFFNHYFDIVNN